MDFFEGDNKNILNKIIDMLSCVYVDIPYNMVYINKNSLFNSQDVLSQGDATSQYYDIDDLRSAVTVNNVSPSTRMIVLVEDTEGKDIKNECQK